MELPRFLQRALMQGYIRFAMLRERLESGVAYNPLSPALRVDPYPFYKRLQTRDPVHRSRLTGGLVLTRHADVSALLRDDRLGVERRRYSQDTRRAFEQFALGSAFVQTSGQMLLFRDPPDHTRLRGLVSKAFTPRVVAGLRPRIEQIVDELLDQAEAAGEMDVIRDLAYPLPVIVISEMLGVPPEDRHLFKEWSDGLATGLEPSFSLEDFKRADVATESLREYMREVIADRRRQPREDLISALVAAEEAGEHLTEDELYATVILLLVAGNETTTNLIGNGLLALLRNPEQWRNLCDDPALIEQGGEELLRYDSPVQFTSRIAKDDCLVAGKPVPKNREVVAIVGAANRDPEQFENADALDLTRKDVRHLSFGMGSHYCLGAPLARLEGQVALAGLAQRFPGMRLGPQPPRWRDTIVLRGLRTLPVTLG